jgi:hypothetical protein
MVSDPMSELTILVHVVFTLSKIAKEVANTAGRLLSNGSVALCQDEQLVSRDVVLLNRFGDDLLGDSVAVDVCRVPSIYTSVICRFQQRQGLQPYHS